MTVSFSVHALVVGDAAGSIDLVNDRGDTLARLNIFALPEDEWLAVDIIDVKERYSKHTALTFKDGVRNALDAGKVVGADFRAS